jgi:TolB-like protein
VDRAVHNGLSVINLRLEDVPLSKQLEYYISSVHWLDAITPPLEKHLKQLCSIVQMFLKPEEVKDVEIAEAFRKGILKQSEPAGVSRRSSSAKRKKILLSGSLLTVAIVIVLMIVFNIGGIRKVRAGSIDSIVILPFSNYTGIDTLDTYLSGMHWALINELGKIKGLRVISDVSSNSYKNTDKTIPQIAKELNVAAAIELGVLCYGDTICMQPRLMSGGGEEKQLWIGDYSEKKGNLFNMYNQIIRQIANEVKISLTPKEEAKLVESRTIDREALDAYLKGAGLLGDISPELLLKSRDYLNRAIGKDPHCALLYAKLATVWLPLGGFGVEPIEVANSKAYENAQKALELDPDLAEAHYIKAWLAIVTEWNMKTGEKEFLKALANNPSFAVSRMHYSWFLYAMQQPEEAKIQADSAYKLDLLNPVMQCFYAIALSFGGDCASALALAEKVTASDPNNWYANNTIVRAAFQCGDLNRVFEAEKHIMPLEAETMHEIEKIFNERGFPAALEEIMRHMEILAEGGHVTPIAMANGYYMLNQDDKVMEWIEKGVEVHDADLWSIGRLYPRLYDNPRFIAICKKINLPLSKSD